jgi:hypothetical protein
LFYGRPDTYRWTKVIFRHRIYVFWKSRFHDSAWIAYGHDTGRNRLDDDAARADHGIVAYFDHHYGAVPDPRVAPDAYLLDVSALFADWPRGIVEAMGVSARDDIHVAADERAVADFARTERASPADINAVPDSDAAMGDPGAEFDGAVRRKRFQNHPIKSPA